VGDQLLGQICAADRADASLGDPSSIGHGDHVIVVEADMALGHI